MYQKIVDAIVDTIYSTYGDNYSLDDVKLCINLAMNITSNFNWSDQEYNDMFDDVILGLDHPGESFIKPLN